MARSDIRRLLRAQTRGRPGAALEEPDENALFYYGLAARIPVILIMGLAISFDSGTHYDAFPPPMAQWSKTAQFLVGAVFTQLVVWASIWTVGSGMLTGMLVARIRSPRPATT